MNFQELKNNSGDATLIDYTYKNQEICIKLELFSGELASFKANTSQVIVNNHELKVCYIDTLRLSSILLQENGFYIPNKDFGKFMQEIKQNLHLGYGLKEKLSFFW